MQPNDQQVTLQIGSAQLSVATQELFNAWLEKHLGVKPASSSSITVPAINDGEVYAGIILHEDGRPSHHVILLPGDNDDADWKTQMKWAAKAGGDLPTRAEQSLLYANAKKHFKEAAYWSSESHSNDGSAWYQSFDDGYQDSTLKGYALRGRAVRRLVIE